jgi:hypothetical protein
MITLRTSVGFLDSSIACSCREGALCGIRQLGGIRSATVSSFGVMLTCAAAGSVPVFTAHRSTPQCGDPGDAGATASAFP